MERVNIIETNLDFANELTTREATDMIVIHHTGSGANNDMDASAEQIHGWHLNNGWAGIGYHYVVRKDGSIETGRPHWVVGSHAYGENWHTIGIHLSGDFTVNSPTDAQIEAVSMLIANLCTDYGLMIDRNHIVGHRDIGDSDCPGDVLYSMIDTIIGKAIWYQGQ